MAYSDASHKQSGESSPAGWVGNPPSWSTLLSWLGQLRATIQPLRELLAEHPCEYGFRLSGPSQQISWHWSIPSAVWFPCDIYLAIDGQDVRTLWYFDPSCNIPHAASQRMHIAYHPSNIETWFDGCISCLSKSFASTCHKIAELFGITQPSPMPLLPEIPNEPRQSQHRTIGWLGIWKPMSDRVLAQGSDSSDGAERSELWAVHRASPRMRPETADQIYLDGYFQKLLDGPWIRGVLLSLLWQAIHQLPSQPRLDMIARLPPIPPSFEQYAQEIERELLAVMLGGANYLERAR
jgi:hypothetical protein